MDNGQLQINELTTILNEHFQWNKARMDCFVGMLGALMAVVYKGAAIPVYWLPLNKPGNSNSRERIVLMKRFISQFNQNRIKGLLADREFIGDEWMSWLIDQKIQFNIRKTDTKIFL
jgi:hypothetical protein